MLDCKLCNYYQSVSGRDFRGMDLGICEFTDMLFVEDTDNMMGEYPCRKIEYNDYLRKKSAASIDTVAAAKLVDAELFHELKQCGVSMIKFPEGIIKKCFENQLEKKSREMHREVQVNLLETRNA
ncbi:hypothetical protein [Caproiciproducens faecalis]|uniref:Uncharacterized protein n=1 Tax=Caproiciproducens faecalis TaxID=2820301 RepID=A0ABS7DLA6_9FIRM|nr:hypothetical protein [Caproiciproducens faecalis]MBW7572081.1 hypothetical protein [Caproiciproducens faecalis]